MQLLPLSFLIFVLIFPVLVLAQVTEDPKPPKVLAKEEAKGAQIYYLGHYEGMNGWALVRKGKVEYFYENKGRTALVMGMLFNEDGEMLTLAQLSMLKDRIGEDAMFAATGQSNRVVELDDRPLMNSDVSSQNLMKVEALSNKQNQSNLKEVESQQASRKEFNRPLTRADYMYVDLVQANWIVMNPEGQYEVLAFIDPDCPHCKQMIRDQSILSGPQGIKMHMILVGLQDESVRRSAMLLATSDPIEKLLAHVQGEILTPPEEINTKAIQDNLGLMYKYGFDVTPLIVYKTRGHEIRLLRGVPNDFNTIINDIKNN